MGNRAIVKPIDKDYGVYLHWNGGIDSVEGFLEYCKLKAFRPFGGVNSDGYCMARFCQVVGNFFGGGLSIGIVDVDPSKKDYGWFLDNGVYIVDGWDIVDHKGNPPYKDDYDLQKFMLAVDKTQPEKERLGEKCIRASIHNPEDVKVGDIIYDISDGAVREYTVLGKTEDGVPYIDKYTADGKDYLKYPCNLIVNPVRIYRLPPF